jgi:predicted nuclease of restriction endonuclease-like RecB superfamily
VVAASRLSSSVEGQRLVLHYLGAQDEPWLCALLDVCARFAGKRQLELRERLNEPLPTTAPRNKLRLAMQVLERLLPEAPKREPSPRELRFRLFQAAARSPAPRREIIGRVARDLRVEVEQVEDALFADLASQRRVGPLPADLSPARLALLANQALVFAFLKRAERVRIRAWGDTRALIRHARLLGLICVIKKTTASEDSPAAGPLALPARGVLLEMSGPFALFRKTEVYGRSLASLLPRAARCLHFELEADCVLSSGAALCTLLVSPSDPIYPASALPSYGSRVEAGFARDFGRLATDWQLVREPEPVEADGALIFPDFELYHRHDSTRRWLLEIVGFWTPEYLREKLAKLEAANLKRLIVCVDDARRCSEADLPPHARVLRYKSRIDVARVLRMIEAGGDPLAD